MGCKQSRSQRACAALKEPTSGNFKMEPDSDSLTVIVVHYNPCQYKRRAVLVNDCISRLCDKKGQLCHKARTSRSTRVVPKLHIVAVELTYGDQDPDIVPREEVDLIRRSVAVRDVMWSKEQLINLAIKRLPAHCKYISWMDSDIAFIDDEWVESTIGVLSTHPKSFAQLWATCDMLGPDGNPQLRVTSFAQQYTIGKTYQDVANKHKEYWHPGFVWAATREALECTNGLIAQTLGSADRHMAMAFLNRAAETVPKGLHASYRTQVLNWEQLVQLCGIELVVVPLKICHFFHGSMKHRQYMERWDILKVCKFDLLEHLQHDPDQDLYVWSDSCPYLLVQMVSDYFQQRQEDSDETDDADAVDEIVNSVYDAAVIAGDVISAGSFQQGQGDENEVDVVHDIPIAVLPLHDLIESAGAYLAHVLPTETLENGEQTSAAIDPANSCAPTLPSGNEVVTTAYASAFTGYA